MKKKYVQNLVFMDLLSSILEYMLPDLGKKKIKVIITGKSYSEIIANPQATSVIPHTLIDNSVKYSPPYKDVIIHVQDCEKGIDFSVSSYGPLIKAKEFNKIFEPFFRTNSAKQMVEEGAGYGLYISQTIAKNHFHTIINVKQDPNRVANSCYWTTFSVRIPIKASILD